MIWSRPSWPATEKSFLVYGERKRVADGSALIVM
jgi:hypothetical protein